MEFAQVQYGGDYNPEQWSPETWEEDARLMQAAGVNLVTLAVFAWAKLEPAPGEYDFAWLDQVMDLLYAHGVRVDLATSTAAPPAWLVRLHPEILPINMDGVTLWHGSRRHYCPHSPSFQEAAGRVTTALAEHVRSHPALALWHVDNELACHYSECFCETSISQFRLWLKRRYGSIGKLNDAWGTGFWSQAYGDWEEITAPRRVPATVNPAQKLDWLRFCSDSWIGVFSAQKAILKKITPAVPVTTNFMSFFKPVDYFALAAEEDIVSNDSYPDLSDPHWMVQSAMACDLVRSLKKGQPWLLMEQAPSQVNWRLRNAPKRPGQMRLGSYQALGRGANGILFFQWRASTSGSEKFHSAMLPHAGADSRLFREIKEFGAELPRLESLLASRVRADTAILFDWNNWWAFEGSDKPANDLKLLPEIEGIYSQFFQRNISVDFAHPEEDLSRYKLVIAPQLYLLSERAAKNMETYVANGGTLLVNFFSGIVNENDRVLPGGYPALLRDVLGMWVEEFIVLMEDQANTVISIDEDEYSCGQWSDILHLEGAESLAAYQKDFFAGSPAVTRHSFGKGTAFYLGTSLGPDGLGWLLDLICMQAAVEPVLKTPKGIEAVRRTVGGKTWIVLLNHSGESVKIPLPETGLDLISGKIKKTLTLAPEAVSILQFPSGSQGVDPHV